MSEFQQDAIERLTCDNIQLRCEVRALRATISALEEAAADDACGVIGADTEFSRVLSTFRRVWKSQRRDDAPEDRERVEKNAGQKQAGGL